MTRQELEEKLDKIGYLNRYSLDGSLCPDHRILYKNYSVWEYFYIDERGNRTPPKLFTSEEKITKSSFKEGIGINFHS